MNHVAQIPSSPAAPPDRPGRDRLWHPRPVLCAVCTARVFSPGNEMTISLLLYPDRAPSRWEMTELEEEPTLDTFDKSMGGHTG